MLRDATERHQPLAKEAVAVLAGVHVSVTDDVGVGVGGRLDSRPSPSPNSRSRCKCRSRRYEGRRFHRRARRCLLQRLGGNHKPEIDLVRKE